MKSKIYLLFLILWVVIPHANAQKFGLTDGKQSEIFFSGQQHITGQLRFQNLTDDYLLLSWETVDFSIPDGQSYNVCDNYHCFLEIPPIGQITQMDTIRKNEYGFLKPELRNWNCQEKITTRMVFDVYPSGMKSESQRVTFLFHCFPTGITESISEAISIFPNPFNEEINIHLQDKNIEGIYLYNALGQSVRQTTQNQLLTSDLPAGVYFLKVDFSNSFPLIYKMIKP